ncbi:MAG TPA: T9SS type A sorting domain-containing protein [Chitinophagaceae bacterium]|nr:T9SS type A sorting domain-containing protein [Chitinophagaceae bacterium]
MRNQLLQLVQASLLSAVFSTFCYTVSGQQNITANKDDTHPEASEQQYAPARITLFSAAGFNGYNEIQWSAMNEQDTRRYIVEYSADGINYQTAGEAAADKGVYNLKHYTTDIGSFLYRIRIEKKDNRFVYSASFLLEGTDRPPVKIYPTIVEGNTLNLKIYFPVQSLSIYTTDGRQLMQKDMGGYTGTTQLVLPSPQKGIYFIHFIGNGWKSTEKFIVGR